jgi:hypothetical protein
MTSSQPISSNATMIDFIFVISTPTSNWSCGFPVLNDICKCQIEANKRARGFRLKAGLQRFITNACSFLESDSVGPLEKYGWCFDTDQIWLLGSVGARKVKAAAAIAQASISKIANSRFRIAHAVSSLGAIVY